MSRLKFMMVLLIVIASVKQLHSQQVQMTKEQLIALTPFWQGEDFADAMASAHVCAIVPNFLILVWQSYFHTDPMLKDIIKYDGEWVKDSFITLSEKPGIGVEINEEGMKKCHPGNTFF